MFERGIPDRSVHRLSRIASGDASPEATDDKAGFSADRRVGSARQARRRTTQSPEAVEVVEEPECGARVRWWEPGSGKHRLDGARDAVRQAASLPHRVLIATGVIVVVIAIVLVAVLMRSEPEPVGAPPLPVAQRGSPSISSAPRTESMVVSVVGEVRKPGLVRLPPGARVDDALRAAGGVEPKADLRTVNLARKVTDGEQIFVPSPGAAGTPAGTGAGGAGASDPAGKININSATAEQLEQLPGVGEVTAANILAWRERNGPFTAVEQLREVDGIGERRLAQLRDRVVV